MFEITPISPEHYRQQTRRSTALVALIFVALAMLLATLSVQLFGEPGAADNFRWNLLGVALGFVLTVVLVRQQFWHREWMAAAVYGWGLKRSLMRITNVMHHVRAGVAQGDETAMKLLRFYHLGVTQMHQLDGNSSELSQMVHEIDAHRDVMLLRGLELEQTRLDPAWLEQVKVFKA
ncbi:DUF3087 domain-containing protein [Ectopseudomonas khazarica]|uniref:DUF3087 domain-containing protein n=1 Tax=Ectopseudomonas khazarica TaxID=2502979 RepID=UPI003A901682